MRVLSPLSNATTLLLAALVAFRASCMDLEETTRKDVGRVRAMEPLEADHNPTSIKRHIKDSTGSLNDEERGLTKLLDFFLKEVHPYQRRRPQNKAKEISDYDFGYLTSQPLYYILGKNVLREYIALVCKSKVKDPYDTIVTNLRASLGDQLLANIITTEGPLEMHLILVHRLTRQWINEKKSPEDVYRLLNLNPEGKGFGGELLHVWVTFVWMRAYTQGHATAALRYENALDSFLRSCLQRKGTKRARRKKKDLVTKELTMVEGYLKQDNQAASEIITTVKKFVRPEDLEGVLFHSDGMEGKMLSALMHQDSNQVGHQFINLLAVTKMLLKDCY